jgi:putative membrane protein
MLTAALFGTIGGIVHVGFFVMEALLWQKPAVWKIFGVRSQGDADIQAFALKNQGWYNLFLAGGAFWGVTRLVGLEDSTLFVYANLFMVGAALVLLISNSKLWRGFIVQALAPSVALVSLML